MSGAINKEISIHRLMNQRRVAFALLGRIGSLLDPGIAFGQALGRLFKSQGKFGSRDRRLYRELVYAYLRYEPWLKPLRDKESAFMDTLITLASPSPEIIGLYATLPSSIPGIATETQRHRLIGKSENDLRELLPSWFESHLSKPLDSKNLQALFTRPPLWIRIQNGDAPRVSAQLKSEIETANTSNAEAVWGIPDALRCPPDFPIVRYAAYFDGDVEIQDISSQLILQLILPRPEGNWLDACAGAGGKSLQLAKMLLPDGAVSAFDPRRQALEELQTRRKRARLNNIATLDSPPTNDLFDGVLVDAPCSGSGTWRRHPYLMRQTREKDVFDKAKTQCALLDRYSRRVAPGGTLAYCTCSLSRYENEAVAARFIEGSDQFEHQPLATDFDLEETSLGISILPATHDGDGLYIATFRRK